VSIHCIVDHDARTVLVQVSTAGVCRSIVLMETCTSDVESSTSGMEWSTCSIESCTPRVHRPVSKMDRATALRDLRQPLTTVRATCSRCPDGIHRFR